MVGVEPNLAAIPEPLQQLVEPLEKAVTEAGTPQECRSLLDKAAVAAKASSLHTASLVITVCIKPNIFMQLRLQ